MAECPSTWDLVTASLAVCDLAKPVFAWAFLVVQGLVRDDEKDWERFVQIVREEREVEITGPTAPARIAARLSSAGIVLPGGSAPDSWGRVAAQRLQVIEPWTGGDLAGKWLAYLREMGV